MATPTLQLTPCRNFTNQINDNGSRANASVSFWTPSLPISGNYCWFGMTAYPCNSGNYPAFPTGALTYLAQAINDPNGLLLQPPQRLQLIWSCTGNGQPSNLGICTLVPPPGYVGLGLIAIENFNNIPDISNYPNLMCVNQSLVAMQQQECDFVWCDKGSCAPLNISVYNLQNAHTAMAVNTPSPGMSVPAALADFADPIWTLS